jgi:hypothetical protein
MSFVQFPCSDDPMQLFSGFAILQILLSITLAIGQLSCINKALRRFPSVLFLPLYCATLLICGVTLGGIHYHEFSRFRPINWAMFIVGCGVALLGILTLTAIRAKIENDNRHLNPRSDGVFDRLEEAIGETQWTKNCGNQVWSSIFSFALFVSILCTQLTARFSTTTLRWILLPIYYSRVLLLFFEGLCVCFLLVFFLVSFSWSLLNTCSYKHVDICSKFVVRNHVFEVQFCHRECCFAIAYQEEFPWDIVFYFRRIWLPNIQTTKTGGYTEDRNSGWTRTKQK